MADFDDMAALFTNRVRLASDWKLGYPGAAYSSRIRLAIKELKQAIAEAEAHPEIGGSGDASLASVLCDVSQILNVVKAEWSAANAWSAWDQSVSDRVSALQTHTNT